MPRLVTTRELTAARPSDQRRLTKKILPLVVEHRVVGVTNLHLLKEVVEERGLVECFGWRFVDEFREEFEDREQRLGVIEVVERAGLSRVVARLRPLGVVKG